MALTPRSFWKNPFLLMLFCLTGLTIPAGVVMMSTTCHTKSSQTRFVPVERTIHVEATPAPAVQTLAQTQGWLGVHIQTLNPHRARHAMRVTKGVLVLDVQKDRPAHTAGFSPRDIVTHFNGRPMSSACQLKRAVLSTSPESRVPVRVIRNGVPVTLYPTVTSRALGGM